MCIRDRSIADWYRAWDTIRPSGPLPIGSAASSGSFSIAVYVTKSEVPKMPLQIGISGKIVRARVNGPRRVFGCFDAGEEGMWRKLCRNPDQVHQVFSVA